MARGSAVETGMLHGLHGKEGAADTALANFDLNMAGEIADHIEVERKMIGPMVEQCAKWKAPSPVVASQFKVEHWFDGVSVPLVGPPSSGRPGPPSGVLPLCQVLDWPGQIFSFEV